MATDSYYTMSLYKRRSQIVSSNPSINKAVILLEKEEKTFG